jgi:hypothetical protein
MYIAPYITCILSHILHIINMCIFRTLHITKSTSFFYLHLFIYVLIYVLKEKSINFKTYSKTTTNLGPV